MSRRSVVVGCAALLVTACGAPRGEQLCSAIARRDGAAVRQLLAGPPIDATRAYRTCVPADVFSAAEPGDAALTDIGIALLAAGLPADASWTPPGRTEPVRAVEAAARNGNGELVRALLAVGLDVRSAETTRALIEAAGAGHLGVVALLVDEGADLDATSGGETALDRARANGHAEVVRFLEDTINARAEAPAAAGEGDPR